MTVRVVLVEDHALFRAGVRTELGELKADDGTARARLLPAEAPAATVAAFVADRYGTLVYQSLAATPVTLDPPSELLSWARFVGMQCTECFDHPDS